jgi:hypothetical protein
MILRESVIHNRLPAQDCAALGTFPPPARRRCAQYRDSGQILDNLRPFLSERWLHTL